MNLKITLVAVLLSTMICSPTLGQLIVAHRGASHDAPENTLAAFRLAWKQNADAIEADFHLTADNQIVCIHDKTTERTSPGTTNLNIADSNLAELKKLDVGRWMSKKFARETMPTLTEVMSTVPEGKMIFVEIKCGIEIVPHLSKAMANSKLKAEQIVLICFQQNVVRALRAEMPQYKCNWLTGYKNDNDEQKWQPSSLRVMEILKELKPTGLGSNFKREVVDQSFVDSVKAAGLEFHVWTVDDPKEIATAIKLNVDSVTTNRPDMALKIREKLKAEALGKPISGAKTP